MKVGEFFEGDEQVDEAAIRQFKKKRGTNTLERRYRCTSGPKAGKMAANPNACNRRPDPKKRRHGRKVMRVKKATIQRKSRVAKRKTISKTLTRLNARLMSKDVTPSDFSSNK